MHHTRKHFSAIFFSLKRRKVIPSYMRRNSNAMDDDVCIAYYRIGSAATWTMKIFFNTRLFIELSHPSLMMRKNVFPILIRDDVSNIFSCYRIIKSTWRFSCVPFKYWMYRLVVLCKTTHSDRSFLYPNIITKCINTFWKRLHALLRKDDKMKW